MSETITLTHAELAQIIAQAVASAMSQKQSAGALRTARYRERKASQSVTCDGKASQSVTKTPSPSPPPLSPLHPPIPAPTPAPPHTHTREAGPELFPAEPKPKRNKARATDAAEVEAFALSIGCLPGQGEACFWKWEGNGWQNGKAPIKDWQATVRAWKAQGYAPFTPFNATPASQPREPLKSFAQQDAERKAAERHGPEVIKPKILFSASSLPSAP